MKPIRELRWDDEAILHLDASHQVTPEEVEEVIFGIEGEEPTYRILRDGEYHVIYGETGDGRLLVIVGELIEHGGFRPFGARQMNSDEKRSYRRTK